jgi:hypothetical protein
VNQATARQLGAELAALLQQGEVDAALQRLQPLLSTRMHFRLLDELGKSLAEARPAAIRGFLNQVGEGRSMGGWVVIASALRVQLSSDFHSPLVACKRYVELADVWYATDIFGERVPGPSLLKDLPAALAEMSAWRMDENSWVRCMPGVALHYWAKRTRGEAQPGEVNQLLEFIQPMFSEKEMDALKGIGWGLKTLGRYYPEPVSKWLMEQVVELKRPFRKLMVKKASTYLPGDVRTLLQG